MKFKQFTVASCFSSFMLPHVLFVEELEARKKAVMSCCLAWNISLFPSAEQEDHIERIWQMVEADNQDAPPPGLEQGFKLDLRMLVAQKQELADPDVIKAFAARVGTERYLTALYLLT